MAAPSAFSYLRRMLLGIVVMLLLQGCSAVRLGYNNADSLARWWIDQYVDLSPEQDALLRERLSRLHLWHRRAQLPEYASLARQAQKIIAGQPTSSDALTLLDGVIRGGQVLAAQATPDIADFLLTLSPGQIERMAGQFAEKNAVFAREVQLADGESGQRKAQLKRVLEREWLELARLVQRTRPPREQLSYLLQQYAARFDLPSDPLRLAQAQSLRRNSAELFLLIHATATAEQRAHALHKLDDLANDFASLSAGR
ncbi:MAG: DUF6279 family lipoprotein [Proteobacteria bacterium]|nr:DUF6279 family lipoprotein [Pseudomonadota bacterium]